MSAILVDTGPLVALLNARDQHHEWARSTFATLAPPLLTCEAVIAETCHLLRRLHGGTGAVLTLIGNGVVQIPFELRSELQRVRTLLDRYASVPMSLADASLVRMAELDSRSRIVTLDSDFQIYRRDGRHPLHLISPA